MEEVDLSKSQLNTEIHRIFEEQNTTYVNAISKRTEDYFNIWTIVHLPQNNSTTLSNNSHNTDGKNNHRQIRVAEQESEKFYWNKVSGSVYENNLIEAYEDIVY